MRILGLDYGDKRIGVAVSDGLGITAQGVEVIKRGNQDEDIKRIAELVEKYQVKEIVIGLPLNMNGTIGPKARAVMDFIEVLKKTIHAMQINTWDERLSTMQSERMLIEADVSRGKRRKVIDKISANVILQSYLDYRNAKLGK